jgi:hypothetical protein
VTLQTTRHSVQARLNNQSAWFGLGFIFFAVAIARSWTSIHRLVPDPGLGFQLSARADGPADWLSRYGGYPQFIPRVLSEFLALVPLAQLTYWATIVNALLISLCAIALTAAVRQEANTKIALVSGLLLASAYPAFEGLIGNIWAVRWVLLPTTCVIAVTNFSKKHPSLTLVLFAATGLSHAYIFIPASAFILRLVMDRGRRLQDLILGAVLAMTTLFQAIAFLSGSRQGRLYGEATIYLPWQGAGVYWWSVFMGPILITTIAVLFATLTLRKFADLGSATSLMSIQAVLLTALAYGQLGIKSSPAVASIPLAMTALLLASRQVNGTATRRILRGLVSAACIVGLFTLSARYYFASPYLTSGPIWSEVVNDALARCQIPEVAKVEMIYFRAGDFSNSELLPCEVINDWNKWFYQR